MSSNVLKTIAGVGAGVGVALIPGGQAFTPALIKAGLAAGSQVIGSTIAAGASKKAAETQERAATRAATDTRQSTADALAYIERMRTGGAAPTMSPAHASLSRLLGVPSGDAAPMAASRPRLSRVFGASPMPNGAPAAMATDMVLVEAPDGSRRRLPSSVAQQAIARGARRVDAM